MFHDNLQESLQKPLLVDLDEHPNLIIVAAGLDALVDLDLGAKEAGQLNITKREEINAFTCPCCYHAQDQRRTNAYHWRLYDCRV